MRKVKKQEIETVICDFCGISQSEFEEIAGHPVKFGYARPGYTGDMDLCPYCKQMMQMDFKSWSKILRCKAEIIVLLADYYKEIGKWKYLQERPGTRYGEKSEEK